MGINIRGTGPSVNDTLPDSRLDEAPRSKRVGQLRHANHKDTSRRKAELGTAPTAVRPGRVQFEFALKARGVDEGHAAQLLDLFDLLLESDGESTSALSGLLYSAVAADLESINQQVVESASMLVGAVTGGGLASAECENVLEHFAKILEDGQINNEQHAELQTLIGTVETESLALPNAETGKSGPSDPVDSQKESAQAEEAFVQSIEMFPVAVDTHPLTPAATGVDPQQLEMNPDPIDDVSGLMGPEFVHALYGSGTLSGLSPLEQLKFSQYAGALFIAYANEDDFLFDDEITLMQSESILVETDGGWTLDVDIVAERIDSPFMTMPSWLPLPPILPI